MDFDIFNGSERIIKCVRKYDTSPYPCDYLAKNRYEVMKSPVGLNVLTQGTIYYNAFDCPHCGCQNITGVVEKAKVKDFDNKEEGAE